MGLNENRNKIHYKKKKNKPDKFQNFDIVFLVRQIRSFTIDYQWTDIFAGSVIAGCDDSGAAVMPSSPVAGHLKTKKVRTISTIIFLTITIVASGQKPDSLTKDDELIITYIEDSPSFPGGQGTKEIH